MKKFTILIKKRVPFVESVPVYAKDTYHMVQ